MALRGVQTPFASIEVRWFLAGESASNTEIRRWFEHYSPFPRDPDAGVIEWRGRSDDEPDAYLILPGYEDMGIKWREGTLQIKGLVADMGPHCFGGRHEGRIQRWLKWTYDDIPVAYHRLFELQQDDGREIVAVRKIRALRMFRFDGQNVPREVAPRLRFEQGLGFELTDLDVGGERFCSIAFEAFPDSPELEARFNAVVEELLAALGAVSLTLAQSKSYPAWVACCSG